MGGWMDYCYGDRNRGFRLWYAHAFGRCYIVIEAEIFVLCLFLIFLSVIGLLAKKPFITFIALCIGLVTLIPPPITTGFILPFSVITLFICAVLIILGVYNNRV